MKSRKTPICDIEIGHRSSSTAILGNLALRSGAPVDWDGKTETITNGNTEGRGAADVRVSRAVGVEGLGTGSGLRAPGSRLYVGRGL